MADLSITPSQLKGKIFIPPSKSHTMRALIFASMGKGKSAIANYLPSPDIEAMVKALGLLGVKIEKKGALLEVEGRGELSACRDVIDAGNSGQILRFIGCLATLLPTYTVITGDESIRTRRPIAPLLSAITQLNGWAFSTKLDGRPPIIVKGPITPGHALLSGEDSQPISGLLMAASFLEGKTTLEVVHPGETPWIDLTLSWLQKLGGKIEHDNYSRYAIQGPLGYDGFEASIPGDCSTAAFPLAAAIITGSQVTLENIDMLDVQGDKKVIDLLSTRGAQLEIDLQKKRVCVKEGSVFTGGTIDVGAFIDAIPILAVMACFAEGDTLLVNGAIARTKESDRLHAIALELGKMGACIEEREDGLKISPSPLRGAFLHSHFDHRIALSLSVAALAARGPSRIVEAACIAKSYPTFIPDFQRIGASIG